MVHYELANLNADRVIGNRAYDNIVWMNRNIGIVRSVHHHKFYPFLRVVRKKLYVQSVLCRLVYVKFKAGQCGASFVEESSCSNCHLHSLVRIGVEIESLSEIFATLTARKVNVLNCNV